MDDVPPPVCVTVNIGVNVGDTTDDLRFEIPPPILLLPLRLSLLLLPLHLHTRIRNLVMFVVPLCSRCLVVSQLRVS